MSGGTGFAGMGRGLSEWESTACDCFALQLPRVSNLSAKRLGKHHGLPVTVTFPQSL